MFQVPWLSFQPSSFDFMYIKTKPPARWSSMISSHALKILFLGLVCGSFQFVPHSSVVPSSLFTSHSVQITVWFFISCSSWGQVKELKFSHFMFFVVYQRAYNAKSKMGLWHINIAWIHSFLLFTTQMSYQNSGLSPTICSVLGMSYATEDFIRVFSSFTFLDVASCFMNLRREKFIWVKFRGHGGQGMASLCCWLCFHKLDNTLCLFCTSSSLPSPSPSHLEGESCYSSASEWQRHICWVFKKHLRITAAFPH